MWPGRGLLTSWMTFSRSASRSDGHVPGIYGPGLAEDVEPVAHPAQGLHDLYGVQLIIEPKSREGKRDHQGCREIEGERRRDGAIQGVTRGGLNASSRSLRLSGASTAALPTAGNVV